MAKGCSECTKFVDGKEGRPGFCVKEQTDVKGGRFWTAGPAKAKKAECRDFEENATDET